MTNHRNFEAFMEAYQDMVYSTAIRLTGNAAEAEDIAQEVFLKAYERYDQLAGNPACAGWLRTVARNLSLNHLTRYRARWHFFSEMSSGEEGDREFVETVAGRLTEQPGSGDRQALLERAIWELPAAFRVPLVLYHFEDLSYDEIAHQLKVSLSKVKTDIHRAREKLRLILERSGVVAELQQSETHE